MAYPDLVGVDFRSVTNIAAMAPAVDLHISLLANNAVIPSQVIS